MEIIEINCNSEKKQKFEELIYYFRFCGFWIHEKNSNINDNTRLKTIRNIDQIFEKDEPSKLFSYSEADYIAKIYIYNSEEQYNNHPVTDKDIIILSGNCSIESDINKNFITYSDFIDKKDKLVEKIIDIMKNKKLISKDIELEMKILSKFYFENNVYPLLASSQRLFINKNKNINDNISEIYRNVLKKLKFLLKKNVEELGQISTMHIQNAFVYFLCEACEFEKKRDRIVLANEYEKLIYGITQAILKNNSLNIHRILRHEENELIKIPCLSNIVYYAIRNEDRLYDFMGTKMSTFLCSYYNQYFMMDAVKRNIKLITNVDKNMFYYWYPMVRKLPKLFPDDYNAWINGLMILNENEKYAHLKECKWLDIEKYKRCKGLYINMAFNLISNQYNNFDMKYINDRYKIYYFMMNFSCLMKPYDASFYLNNLINDETNFFKSIIENKMISEPIIYTDDEYDIEALRLDFIETLCRVSSDLIQKLDGDYVSHENIFFSSSAKTKTLQRNNIQNPFF